MSYSRRQLYAMGEPLGDSATYRKADGGLVLGGGGDAPNIPAVTQQTTIADMPDWLKGFAGRMLSSGEALTTQNKPPGIYGGPRIADLSTLQKTAMQTATSPQAFGQTVQGYMSPYQQNVIDIQKREAARQYGAQMAAQGAQAVKSGAFGGSRQGIQQAEGQRNFLQQLGDIQAQGSQAAYQQATQQANAALGQQMQLGAVEQGQRQKALDVAYTDYLEQMNRPYRELGFMSGLIRGTPVGQSAQSQVYQPPPSLTGQIAGLGIGAYGLSQLMGAEGGLMKSYAEGGGVDSSSNVSDIIDSLSDQQLVQAEQAARARGDFEQLQAIMSEKAMRASERRGLASAYNEIPVEQQEAMAGGGIVAFADGDFVVDPMLGTMADTSPGEDDRTILERLGIFNPENRRALEAAQRGRVEQAKPIATAPAAYARGQDSTDAEAGIPLRPTKKESTAISKHPIAKQAIQVGKSMGLPEQDTRSMIKSLMEEMEAKNKPLEEEASKITEAQKGRAADIRKNALAQALMQYGFGMAQQASQPGSTLIRSAAGAAPIFGQVAMEQDKLARAAEDNYSNLRLNELRYQQSVRKGDMQSALQYANLINQDKKSQQMIEIERQKLGIMAQHASQSASTPIQKIADDLQRSNPNISREDALQRASQMAGYSFRTENAAQTKLATMLETAVDKDLLTKTMTAEMLNKTPQEQAAIQQKINQRRMVLRDAIIQANPEFANLAAGMGMTPPPRQATSPNYTGFKILN